MAHLDQANTQWRRLSLSIGATDRSKVKPGLQASRAAHVSCNRQAGYKEPMSGAHPNTRILFEIGLVAPILAWARESGVDTARILCRIGLGPQADELAPQTRLPLTDYFRIQSEIAQALDDLTAQLSERKLLYQSGSFVISQLKSAATLQDTIRSLAAHFNMLHGGTYNLIRQNARTLSLVLDDSEFPYRFRENEVLSCFVRDALLIKVYCLIDSLTAGMAAKALQRVCLVRGRREAGDTLISFWQVPVAYNRSVHELVFDYDLACRPITSPANPDLSPDGMFSRVIRHLESLEARTDMRTFAIRTADLIAQGLASQQAVADAFGISVATLRRRLSEEQTSFRDLVLTHRMEQADALLARGTKVSQVSERLGYSDVRAFNRAFKKLRGMSPAVFARREDILAEGA